MVTDPFTRSVTPIYHDAVANWWALQPVYIGREGFNYLPAFLPGFGIFASLPPVICEILWRWLALTGLGLGCWRSLFTESLPTGFPGIITTIAFCSCDQVNACNY
jgi:hypothetical protein